MDLFKMYMVLIFDLLFASKKVCNPEAFDGFKVADLNGGCDFILTGKPIDQFGKNKFSIRLAEAVGIIN